MKKKLLIITFVIMTMVLFGCQKTADKEATVSGGEEKKLKVVTTIYPQYDFVKEVARDKVEAEMLVKPGSDIHYFEPAPQDMMKIQEADLFIYTGGPDEEWVEDTVAQMENGPKLIKLVDLVDTVEEEIVEGMEHNHDHEEDHDHEEIHAHEEDHEHNHDKDHDHEEIHDHEHHHHEVDEHVWTSLRNAQIITKAISEKLVELDATNGDFYKENAAEYIKKLADLDKKFVEMFKAKENKTLVFGDRFPFRYFVEDYGLDYYAAFSGCSALAEPSAQTLSFLIDKVNELGIKTIYYIESSNGDMAKSIAEATGGKTARLHSVHNLSNEDFQAGKTYLMLMEENLETLRKN